VTSQVLNAYDKYIGSNIRQKFTFTYVRESERTAPITPLRFRSLHGYISLGEAPVYYRIGSHTKDYVPITGSAAEGFPEVTRGKIAGHHVINDALGHKLTGHWIVPPGRNENRTVINRTSGVFKKREGYREVVGVMEDVDIHYIAGHLHPYASSMEIRDITSDSLVFRSDIESSPDGKALTKVENCSGEQPLTLHADHDYELVSIYDNTSDADVTAMAVMHLYVVDNNFDVTRWMQW